MKIFIDNVIAEDKAETVITEDLPFCIDPTELQSEAEAEQSMKAIILINNIPDHEEPYDLLYCIRLAFHLDPKGKFIKIKIVEEP